MPREPVEKSAVQGVPQRPGPAVSRGASTALFASACSLALHGGLAIAIWQAPQWSGADVALGADAWARDPMVLVSWNEPQPGTHAASPAVMPPAATPPEIVPRATPSEASPEQHEPLTAQPSEPLRTSPEPITPEPADRTVERLGRDVDLPPTRAWVGSDVEGLNRGVTSSVEQGAASRQPGVQSPQGGGGNGAGAGVRGGGAGHGGGGGGGGGDSAQELPDAQNSAVIEPSARIDAQRNATSTDGERALADSAKPIPHTVSAPSLDSPRTANTEDSRRSEPMPSAQVVEQPHTTFVEPRTDEPGTVAPAVVSVALPEAVSVEALPAAGRPSDVLARLRELLPSIDRDTSTREVQSTVPTTAQPFEGTVVDTAAPDQVTATGRALSPDGPSVRAEPVSAERANAGPGRAGPGAPGSPSAGPGASTSVGDPGPLADRDSDAASVLFRGVYQWGSVLVGEGLEVRTVRPRFTLTARYLTVPQNPVLRISFGKDGTVRRVVMLRSSGFREERDEPIINAVYKWTASGRAIRELPDIPGATVTIEMTILLN